MHENLLDPLFLFFVVGLIGGLLKADLKLPDAVYHLLSTYLLLAIGLKGGVQLAQAAPAHVAGPALATLALGLGTPVVAFFLAMRVGRLARADAASLAAHYGSASAVTFAAALTLVRREEIQHEGFLPVLLIVLEIPAILVAILLHRWGRNGAGSSYREVLHEVLLNRSVFLLVAGLLVGFVAGPVRFAPFQVLFVDAFKPVLAFFILEMGLLAAHRLPELRGAGPFLIVFAIVMPVVNGMVGAWLGLVSGLAPGGAIVLGSIAASASYIAAPAAMRVAIPEANTGMAVAVSLGITFPFNLALGIPLFARWVEWLTTRVG